MELALCRNEQCANGDREFPSTGFRKRLGPKDVIYQIRIVNSDGIITYAPCCCKECAEAVKQRYETMHYERYLEMKNQSFQIMPLERFG